MRDRLQGWGKRLRHHVEWRDRPVYVFHHVAKTGGVSVRQALGEWFYRIHDYARWLDRSDFWSPREVAPPVDLGQLRRGDCLVGHWPDDGMAERYPEVLEDPGRFFCFTFLREPLDLQLSLYHWEIRKGREHRPMLDALMERPNFQAVFLGADEDSWLRVIDRYFVGLTDRVQESLNLLADRIAKPRVTVPHRNRTARGRVSLPPGFVEDFRQANALDYALYERAAARLGWLRSSTAPTAGASLNALPS